MKRISVNFTNDCSRNQLDYKKDVSEMGNLPARQPTTLLPKAPDFVL